MATIHQRLNEIHAEVMGVDFRPLFEGGHFDASDRAKIRATAAMLGQLMDEYEAIDRELPPQRELPPK